MSLKQITTASDDSPFDVDIVAIHGSFEDDVSTWTEPQANIFWLGDLLQCELPVARILTYGYDRDCWASQAHSLLASLDADREICRAVERPLIFICHGLGGIIVKKALAVSSISKSKQSRNRRSIYVSTCAIIFLATPHDGFNANIFSASNRKFSRGKWPYSDEAASVLGRGSATLQDIDDQFAPLAKRFLIYCFWEQRRSSLRDTECYIVNEESATRLWPHIEQAGLDANHSGVCKFRSARDNGFRIILAALKRYIERSVMVVHNRWLADRKLLKEEDEAGAAELLRDLNNSLNPIPAEKVENLYYRAPRPARKMFTGRSDITRIVRAKFFSSDSNSEADQHKIFVLYGLGGAGKTEFCLKFAQDNKNQYLGVFWVDASTDENAQAAFSELGNIGNKGRSFEAGKSWLSSLRQPWLLVIDNADDPKIDISRYIPAGCLGHILVTTRNPNNVVHATVGEKQFRDMDPEDAVSLLLKAADPADVKSQDDVGKRTIASKIAKALGYLALALVLAGATIQRKICRLEDYLAEYTKNRKTMKTAGNTSTTDSSNLTIIATWEVSYKRIESSSTTDAGDAIDLLRVFAFLHFDHIPEILFEKAWNGRQMEASQQCIESSFINSISTVFRSSTPQMPRVEFGIFDQAGPHWSKSRFRRALALLSDHSLIYYDDHRSMCYMHPVIHAWARDRLSPQLQSQWLNTTATILSASITETMEASGRDYRRLLSSHIDSCLDSGDIKIDEHVDHGARSLRFASVYAECGRWKTAAQIQRHVVEIRRTICGAKHPATLEAMHDLGQSCWNLFNARELLQIETKILQARMGRFPWLRSDDIPTLKALDDLGRTFWLLGNRREAERLGSKAVAGLTRRLGPEDPATLTAMHNLGCTCIHLSQPKRSAELLERVYNSRKLYWGIRHDETLATMNELSMAYLALGRHRYADAERLCRKALEQRIIVLGEEHAYTLWSVNNLSKIYCAQGRYREAADVLEAIMDTVIKTLGEAHVGMTMTTYNLACAYAGMTEWNKAEIILETQLEYINPGHPDWIANMAQLARVCQRGGYQAKAGDICIRVIKQYGIERALNSKNPRMIEIVTRLLEICSTRGEIDSRYQLGPYLHSLHPDIPGQPILQKAENIEQNVANATSEHEEWRSAQSTGTIRMTKTW